MQSSSARPHSPQRARKTVAAGSTACAPPQRTEPSSPMPGKPVCRTRWQPHARPIACAGDPLSMPEGAVDLVEGLVTYGGNGDVGTGRASASTSTPPPPMERRAFQDSDGELLIVPQQGTLHIVTELGRMDVPPGHIALIPRGLRFAVAAGRAEPRLRLRELRRAVPACPTSARSAPTALPTRATSKRRSPGSRIVEGTSRVVQKFQGRAVAHHASTTRRSMSSPGTATPRPADTTSRASTPSARSASTTPTRRSSPC